MRIENATRGTELANAARRAGNLWSRMIGLLGRASLERGEALVLEPCGSVHTAFMRFPIDVVYLDRANRVVKAVRDLKPFRLSAGTRRARTTIELPVGVIDATSTAVGDEIRLG